MEWLEFENVLFLNFYKASIWKYDSFLIYPRTAIIQSKTYWIWEISKDLII